MTIFFFYVMDHQLQQYPDFSNRQLLGTSWQMPLSKGDNNNDNNNNNNDNNVNHLSDNGWELVIQ